MDKKTLPQINGGSVADIAFMLLIFFLVATTMHIDSGITRKLPPVPKIIPDEPEKIIKDRNVFVVLINRNNELLVENEALSLSLLKDKAKEFIANPNNLANLPEKKNTKVDFFGMYPVSKGIISLQNDKETTYGTYVEVQNELAKAYNELRDEISMDEFGRKFSDLDVEKSKAVKKIYPQRISEAEPINVNEN